MTGYVLSPRAKKDIDDIWNYTAARWDETRAETYIGRIKQSVENVAANPRLGRSCDAIRAGYFKYPAGSHILFYKLSDQGIDIIRVLHERMDVGRHL